MASSSATAPAFTSQSWKYDVFLSFRGEDTRKTFVDHLYTAVEQQGIFTYKDDETLPRGESIGPSLIKAIEESQTAVIVFSENYAYSSWCLDELVHIMECKDKRGQIVIPIFYNVEPSEVKNQRRKYGEALAKHELENKNKVKTLVQTFLDDPWGWLSAPREQNKKYGKIYAKQELEYKTKIASWRQALADAGNISGCEPKQIANGHESKVIKEIVDTISQRLKLVTLGANGNLIGIAARMQALQLELQIGLGGVRMIGIWGVGGGGKTTLASSIYDEISSKFDGSCFVKNIREESSKNGLESLQENILSGVLKQKQPQVIRRIEEGRRMIRSRLCHRKLLIVLDDVDHLDQLKALAGSYDWFGEGSRIIITTRDEHVLNAHRVNVIHNIRLLNNDEAIKLFCKHAFQDDRPRKDYEQLSKDVVFYAGGLPLAIKVLGSFLCDKDMNEWRSALTRLKEIPETEIVEKLKISFDGLKGVEKELFLDIACFFRGEYKNERAMMILNACGFHPIIGLKVLIQKALINISSDGMFDMHDLVQEMGHYIVRGEHPKDPEKHSRVWKEEDLRTICAMDAMMELDMIEAIKSVLLADPIHLPPIVANMKNLRWIEWNGGLANPLPTHFSPRKLCFLKLGCIRPKQLWEGYKYLPSLRIMELHNVNNLIRTPDFDGIPNLERFRLSQCPTIKEIHPSIGCLKRLVFLSVEHCFSLEMFPPITRLKILETLTFTGCPELFKLSEIQPLNMDNFPHLHLDTSDTEVKKIQKDLTGLRLFQNGLRELVLSYCNLRDKDMSTAAWDLPNLGKLDLRSNEFSQLNFSCLQLPRVKMLDVSGCRHLVELSELPSSIAVVKADRCTSLESFGDISNCKWLWKVSLLRNNKLGGDKLLHSMLQGRAIEDYYISITIQPQIPKGFVSRLFKGNTFTQHLPNDWYDDFCGFLICIVTKLPCPCVNIIIKQEIVQDSQSEVWEESDNEKLETKYDETSISVGYVSFNKLKHTAFLNSSYNMITFSIDDMGQQSYAAASYVGGELVPRGNEGDDQVQTADGSEFWDKENEDGSNTFTIQQHDSKSSIEILWQHYGDRLSNTARQLFQGSGIS